MLNPVRAGICAHPADWPGSSYRASAGLAEALEAQQQGERRGEERFLRETFGFDPPLAEIPRVQVEPIPPPLEEIFAAASATPVAIAYRRHGYTLRQIAKYVGCSYSTISRRLRREEASFAARILTARPDPRSSHVPLGHLRGHGTSGTIRRWSR